MYCSKCNNQIDDNATFCPHCGESVKSEKYTTWDYFGKAADIAGPIVFGLSFIPIFNFFILGFSIHAIAASILGFKSEKYKNKSKRALGFSIAATAMPFVYYAIYYILILCCYVLFALISVFIGLLGSIIS